jgi:SAM-dependent MidA family methyltransferase
LFDALPIKKFAYHQSSWREVLIDIQKEVKKDKLNFFKKSIKDISKNNIFTNSQSILDPSINNENQDNNLSFEYTYSPPDSINVRKILQPQITFGDDNINPQEGDTYEFSTEQVRYMYSICYLLATTKNAHALICDYGEETAFSNSFRGIKSQKLYKNDEILKYTGECDLSSYVNFKVLKKVINSYQNNLKLGGIIKQGDFLEILQIYERLKVLQKETVNFKIKDILLKQYDRLTRHDQMGDIYKFMYIHKFSNKPIYPFTEYGLNLIADCSKY